MKEIMHFSPSKSNEYSPGILNMINNDQYILKYFKYSSSKVDRGKNKTSILRWGISCQYFSNEGPAYLSLSFFPFAIHLTNYSVQTSPDSCYSKTWNLFGIQDNKTVFLDKQTFSNICKPTEEEPDLCGVKKSNLFTVKETNEIFTTFLITSENGSCAAHGNHISFTGLEFYGTIYRLPTSATCHIIKTIPKPIFVLIAIILQI